jgi:hypothetical protein
MGLMHILESNQAIPHIPKAMVSACDQKNSELGEHLEKSASQQIPLLMN